MRRCFFFVIESSPFGRRVALRSQQRNDDIYFANTTPTNYFEHGLFDRYEISVDIALLIEDFTRTSPNEMNRMLRSGGEPHHSPQPNLDGVCITYLICITQHNKLYLYS